MSAFGKAILADNPLLYFAMRAGASLRDEVSGSNLLTAVNGPVHITGGGKVDGYWHHDGVDDYLTYPQTGIGTALEASRQCTLEMVARVRKGFTMDSNDAYSGMWENGRLRLLLDFNAGNDLRFNVSSSGADAINAEWPNGVNTVSDQEWHHFVGVWDDTVARLYFDGVEVASGSGTAPGTLSDPTNPIPIAARWVIDYGDFGPIEVDEYALYDTALSPARITDHYQRFTGIISTASGASMIRQSKGIVSTASGASAARGVISTSSEASAIR